MLNIAFTRPKLIDLPLIDIEPDRRKPGVHKRADKGQADITKTDYADNGVFIGDFLKKLVFHLNSKPK